MYEPYLRARHLEHKRWDHFVLMTYQTSFFFLSLLKVGLTPHFLLLSVSFTSGVEKNWLSKFTFLRLANSLKLHPQSIFVNVVVQEHAIFAKKDDYNLKIDVPKVTMLCK